MGLWGEGGVGPSQGPFLGLGAALTPRVILRGCPVLQQARGSHAAPAGTEQALRAAYTCLPAPSSLLVMVCVLGGGGGAWSLVLKLSPFRGSPEAREGWTGPVPRTDLLGPLHAGVLWAKADLLSCRLCSSALWNPCPWPTASWAAPLE